MFSLLISVEVLLHILEVRMVQRKLLMERHIYYMYSTYEISVSGRLALPLVNEYGFEEKWGSGRVFGAEIRS